MYSSLVSQIYIGSRKEESKEKESCNVVGGSETSAVSLVDQRRFILQVTFEKLRRLEDPEACLRRTVLINNTLKMLHKQIYAGGKPVCLRWSGDTTSDRSYYQRGNFALKS